MSLSQSKIERGIRDTQQRDLDFGKRLFVLQHQYTLFLEDMGSAYLKAHPEMNIEDFVDSVTPCKNFLRFALRMRAKKLFGRKNWKSCPKLSKTFQESSAKSIPNASGKSCGSKSFGEFKSGVCPNQSSSQPRNTSESLTGTPKVSSTHQNQSRCQLQNQSRCQNQPTCQNQSRSQLQDQSRCQNKVPDPIKNIRSITQVPASSPIPRKRNDPIKRIMVKQNATLPPMGTVPSTRKLPPRNYSIYDAFPGPVVPMKFDEEPEPDISSIRPECSGIARQSPSKSAQNCSRLGNSCRIIAESPDSQICRRPATLKTPKTPKTPRTPNRSRPQDTSRRSPKSPSASRNLEVCPASSSRRPINRSQSNSSSSSMEPLDMVDFLRRDLTLGKGRATPRRDLDDSSILVDPRKQKSKKSCSVKNKSRFNPSVSVSRSQRVANLSKSIASNLNHLEMLIERFMGPKKR